MLTLLSGCQAPGTGGPIDVADRQWLAGDHHIHSRYSVGWDGTTTPPTPKVGGDAIYPIPMNALMARYYGLSWMVTTDHGGPNHSKINMERAYPELQLSRDAVPEVIQFYGMELNTPGADHSSLIIPHSHDEADHLYRLESRFDKREEYPMGPERDTEDRMIEALVFMQDLKPKPVVIANHPSRSAPAEDRYGLDDPAEFRRWNDTAPNIAVGMAGAPGHQAATIQADGSARETAPRAGYRGARTRGGFDRMTARLGGLWDSMLGEGRRWWITANSDSHVNWSEGGYDFWPGEYSKTYVLARKEHRDILEGIRAGRVFVTTGDLVSELYLSVETTGENPAKAGLGETLPAAPDAGLLVTIRFRDPAGENAHGDTPEVGRVDLIRGEVTGRFADPTTDTNASTRVIQRFSPGDWQRHGEYRTMTFTIESAKTDSYLRVRGTNTGELEPERDPPGENPWDDLWFYSNPVFIEVN